MKNYLVSLETTAGFCFIEVEAFSQSEAEDNATKFAETCGDEVLSAFAVRQ